jgi:PAS domain S-box-containing protein
MTDTMSPQSDPSRTAENAGNFLDLLRLAVERAPQGVLVLGEGGRIVTANGSAHVTFGYAHGELVGHPIGDLIPEMPPGAHAASWDNLGGSRISPDADDEIVMGTRKDGVPIPLELTRTVTRSSDSRFDVVSVSDLSDLVSLKARLAAAASSHLGFQRLVSDIALQFAARESSALDELVVDSLRQISEALQLDWSVLWRKNHGESIATATHYWMSPDTSSPPPPLSIASIPFVVSKLEQGGTVCFSRLDDIPDPIDQDTFRRNGLKSAAIVPLANAGDSGVLSALAFISTSAEQEWVPAILERLRLVGGVISQALARRASEKSLSVALDEIHRLKDQLAEPVDTRRELRITKSWRLIVGESAAVKRALAQVEQVAATPATVLLRGETGTGKEVFAQAIHDLSPRHQRPMVVVSCSAIPTALIESELFGRERGAYTGALSRQIGRFEAANQSTLLLDEIGELPMEMQVKLLRVLQERTIERLGSTTPIKVDVRIIAATHRDLEAAVREGTFREDLFYRLNVFPIVVPPLRERIEDIPGLVWAFVDEFSRAFGKTIDSIPKANLRELESYSWPGNVRELRNTIERAVIISNKRQLVVPVPRQPARVPQTAMTLEALEIEHIRKVLESTNWRVRGSGGAAERLGLKPTTLESRMARLGITRSKAS